MITDNATTETRLIAIDEDVSFRYLKTLPDYYCFKKYRRARHGKPMVLPVPIIDLYVYREMGDKFDFGRDAVPNSHDLGVAILLEALDEKDMAEVDPLGFAELTRDGLNRSLAYHYGRGFAVEMLERFPRGKPWRIPGIDIVDWFRNSVGATVVDHRKDGVWLMHVERRCAR